MKNLLTIAVIICLAGPLFSQSTIYKTNGFDFRLEKVFEKETSLWGMTFLPDNSMLITSRSGKIFKTYFDGETYELSNVPKSRAVGQGGMLDIEIHPDYEQNGWIYISYTSVKNIEGDEYYSTSVDRAQLDETQLINRKRIFEALPYRTTSHHFGCRLEFDTDGYLFITIGDRGRRNEFPQSLNSDAGKVHRIHGDGRIPDDNPFVIKGVVSSIYTLGNRNPQGMDRHPITGEIWTHEHGPKGGDEINIIKAGKNYGWPIVSYGINYSGTKFTDFTELPGMEPPLHYWVPSIAPSGMAFVTSDRYPGWENQLLIGSLKFQYLHLCILEGKDIKEEKELLNKLGRVRDVEMGPDGYVYISVESPGRIYRLVPVSEKN